jgi:hypothetical protein
MATRFALIMPVVAAMLGWSGIATAQMTAMGMEGVDADAMAMRDDARPEGAVVAWSALAPPALVEALRGGGLVLLVRHGPPARGGRAGTSMRMTADRGIPDNPAASAKDEARLIGNGLRGLGIPIGAVVTGPGARARAFAAAAFGGTPVIAPDIAPGEPGRVDAYRRYVASVPASGNLVVVGRLLAPTAARISQLDELGGGHAAVYRPDGHGGGDLIALIAPADWASLARIAAPGG